jgi:spermidine synthase
MSFYEELKDHLSAGGTCSVQSTSPLFARKSYWCVENTCRAAGFATLPYHAYVPSFGEWGFILLSHDPQSLSFIDKMESFRFIDTSTWQQMMLFPQDMSELETDVNRLNNQVLVQYFEEEWSHYE